MSDIIKFIVEGYMIFFPTIVGIIIGILNIRTYNKEYCMLEWLFLVGTMIVATFLNYSFMTLK